MKRILLYSTLTFSLLSVSCLKEDDGPVAVAPLEGGTLAPTVGGPSQPNQVWVDLSQLAPLNGEEDQRIKLSLRSDWDLGFYSGNEFRVILNNATLMAAAAIESTNIDAVTQSDFGNLTNTLDAAAGWSEDFIDDPAGNYLDNGTVIDQISINDDENKVYLVKLGYEIYNGGSMSENSAYPTGESRGFKKIRILRNDENSYKIQYADLNSNQHSEFIVEKNPEYHFSFFSFKTENLADIQPEKNNWDICFTVWNNVIEGFGTYTYSDFIITNTLSNVGVYQVNADASSLYQTFIDFSAADVDESLFVYDDLRSMGSNWRSTVSGTSSDPVVFGDRFFVVKDANGLLFKIRFISMLNEQNMRGYPQFEYQPL